MFSIKIHYCCEFHYFSELLDNKKQPFYKNSLFHRKCEKICIYFFLDYTYKNSLFHRISEFHYFSELLDNKVDIMIEHPWVELQVLIREKWLTQKAFSSILWKKVSEVNELLKWKRNITIQRDYLLHQTLWTPIKYRILKQIDYDYSLLNIENSDESSAWILTNDHIWDTDETNVQSAPSEWQTESQETSTQEPTKQDNEDLKNRAQIFRSF
jgi:hypothetical protein